MNFTLFHQLFTTVDTATKSFATDVSGRAITAATPVITAGLTLSFIFYGFLVARGAVEASIKDFFWRCLKIGIIVSIATTGGLYQSQIADAIQKTPDELALALLPSQAGNTQDNAAADVVDKAAGAGFQKAGEAFENSGVFTEQGLAYAAFGVLCVLATAVLTAIGGAFVLLAKVAIGLLAGLGPLFVFALLFKATQRFFETWAGQVFTYGLITVVVSSVFGLMMQIFTTYMNGVNFDGGQSFAGTIGGCVILAIACVVIIIQLPNMAGGLAGGVGVGLWHELRVASGLASHSVGGAKAAASGAVAGGRAVGRGASSAASGIASAVGRFRGSRAA
ncbi:type IV secretion system protein VirB6 [Burkholderia latens]|uniref:type IV secretion system protein n=1 Tax=Burkholderia latens TaxID=488446 RepID=UPI0039A735E8